MSRPIAWIFALIQHLLYGLLMFFLHAFHMTNAFNELDTQVCMMLVKYFISFVEMLFVYLIDISSLLEWHLCITKFMGYWDNVYYVFGIFSKNLQKNKVQPVPPL